MVVDTLENLEKYASLNPLFAQAIEFLKSHDLQAMEIGKTELKGKDLLVNIAQTKPKTKEEAKLEKLAWAPEADERDRIDFIYYYPLESMLSMKNSKLVGPSETVVRGKITENDSKDKILTPSCIWPSDHKGNLATFKIGKKR